MKSHSDFCYTELYMLIQIGTERIQILPHRPWRFSPIPRRYKILA